MAKTQSIILIKKDIVDDDNGKKKTCCYYYWLAWIGEMEHERQKMLPWLANSVVDCISLLLLLDVRMIID
jgi:hypothetical protein